MVAARHRIGMATYNILKLHIDMKSIVIFVIAIMTMATVNANTLTERQKGLAACACLMAQGDLERLEPVTDEVYNKLK